MELRQPLPVRLLGLGHGLHNLQRQREQSAIDAMKDLLFDERFGQLFGMGHRIPTVAVELLPFGIRRNLLAEVAFFGLFLGQDYLVVQSLSPAQIDLQAVLQSEDHTAHLPRLLGTLRSVSLRDCDTALEIRGHCRNPYFLVHQQLRHRLLACR